MSEAVPRYVICAGCDIEAVKRLADRLWPPSPGVSFITNTDGSMYVHALRGAVYVTWVAKEHCDNALEFQTDKAEEWVKLISEMTGVACVAVAKA